jgi:glycosyltransferase involved in cell wall biosynthesis
MEKIFVMGTKDYSKYPRILVVSNNSFSDSTNNGKTLASFFDDYPAENIAQLYLNSELPNITRYNNYYRITDFDVIKSILSKSNICGSRIDLDNDMKTMVSKEKNVALVDRVKNYNLARLAREFFWKSKKWKSKSLEQWLEEFNPEVVFLCAGDSGFAYDITGYVQDKFKTKLVIYVTDDYVLPRKNLSPFWWYRRNKIFNKMKNTVKKSDLFITISDQMKEVYKELLGKDSILAVNMTESLKDSSITRKNKQEITFVYAGGLHYKRYTTLNLLAKSLKKYNDDPLNKQKVFLRIYSGQEINREIKKYLNVKGASEFCGSLNPTQLKKVLNKSDIPVHVESFDDKSIESTRLSISTKIPEYLSLGKPVLAIGPNQVSSMQYLDGCACCITSRNNIHSEIIKFLKDIDLQRELSQRALLKYEKFHKKEIISDKLISNIIRIYYQ